MLKLYTIMLKLLLVVPLTLIRPIVGENHEDFVDLDNDHPSKFKDPRETIAEKTLAVELGMNEFNFTPPDAAEMARIQKMVTEINEVMKHKDNWTTCNEFVDGVTLDIKKLVDIDWQIYVNFDSYYFGEYGTIVRFEIPTSTVVKRFQSLIKNETVKWEEAELLLQTNFDLNILLVRTNVSGIYLSYFEISIEENFNKPYDLLIALKVTDSGYLGMLECKDRILACFAPPDKFPTTPEEAMETVPQFKYKSDYKLRLHLSPSNDFPKPYRGPDTRKQKSYDYGKVDSPKALTIF